MNGTPTLLRWALRVWRMFPQATPGWFMEEAPREIQQALIQFVGLERKDGWA